MSSELRQNVRKRTFLQGRIIFNNSSSTMDCLIRDMSDGGARLELSETSTLPDVFDLFIPAKDQTLRANLCWRRGGEIGIAFPQSKSVAAPAGGAELSTAALMRRIAELEAENLTLRSIISASRQPSAA